jgi:aerobic C4-dicarboxylate transport protein
MQPKRFYHHLYFWVLVGTLIGIATGILLPEKTLQQLPQHFLGPPRQITHEFSGVVFKPLSDGFIKLIRMVIAPIIFTTVVVGMAGMGNLKRVGRIGAKAFIYFEIMTTLALVIGWLVAKTFRPGEGMNVAVASLSVKDLESKLAGVPQHNGFVDMLLNIIPDTIVGAFARGDILPVLFISVLFGMAMSALGESNRPVILALEQVARALMGMIGMIIKLAPLAVFGAMSFTISKFGLASLVPLGKMMACIYLTCLSFVLICLGALLRYNGINVLKLLKYLREELFIVFGTASSESVLPRMFAKLENLGCSKPLVGLVLPAGYSFNLDGTSVYLTMGALFIAQATNTHLTFGQEFAVLIVCLLTSKGAATVVGSAFITLAATLSSMKTIPVEGMVLILGVDWFMAQARSMTNLIGNATATIVIARGENDFDVSRAKKVLNEQLPSPDVNIANTELATARLDNEVPFSK